jgi:prepilin-type N-terminal cleavage/methylation domain-containing protein
MFQRGFTLIEVSVSIGIVALMVTGAVVLVSAEVDSLRVTDTIAKLSMVKHAIVGNPHIVTQETRTDFGYVGDMGSLPASLQDLWVKGSQPAWVYTATSKAGAGWAGPYVQLGPLDSTSSITGDAWGNPIQYQVQTGTSPVTGQEYRARIFSYGADGTTGGGDDLTVEIYTSEMLSTVLSYVRDSAGNPLQNVTVRMNYPSAGILTTSSTTSASGGAYSFSSIPFGNRSVTVEPKLVYADGSAITFSNGEDVEFVMISFTCGNITTATATMGVTSFYQQFRIANTTLFNNGSNMAGSGELVTFNSPYDVSWSGCGGGGVELKEIYPVRVQSAWTPLPDHNIGAGRSEGKSFRVRMLNFETLENGSGSRMDMNGQSISVTFSNGAAISFSPIPN